MESTLLLLAVTGIVFAVLLGIEAIKVRRLKPNWALYEVLDTTGEARFVALGSREYLHPLARTLLEKRYGCEYEGDLLFNETRFRHPKSPYYGTSVVDMFLVPHKF